MSRRYSAVVLFLLVAAIPVFATTISKFKLTEFASAGGRVAFLATGLVVLDAKSGAVIVRERNTRSARLIETPHGLMVGTPGLFRDTRFRLFSTRGDPAWDVTCDLWHAGQDDLICVDSRSSRRHLRIQVRSLTDGQVRWSFDTGDSRGGEALDAKGRLMLVNQEWVYEKNTYPPSGNRSYEVTHEGQFARNTRLTIFDLANGRVLAAVDLNNLRPYGWQGAWPPNFEFDGERVLMRLRHLPGCPSTTVRTYELDLPRAQFRSSDECDSSNAERSPRPPEPAPAWTDLERQLRFRLQTLDAGTLVWSSDFQTGTLLEFRVPGVEPWQLIQPYMLVRREEFWSRRQWVLGTAREQDGLVFLEGNDWNFGTLDAIDLATGRPLWRYVFPGRTVLLSKNAFFSPAGGIGRMSGPDWEELRSNPPTPLIGLLRPVTFDDQRLAEDSALAALPRHEAAPTTFDPAAIRPRSEFLVAVAVSWLPIGLGVGLFIVSRRERVAPQRSLRRVMIGLGLLLCLLGAFLLLLL